MKPSLLTVLLFVAQSHADEIKLRTGEVFSYTKILKIEADGLKLLHNDGVRKIRIEAMTADDIKKYELTQAGAEKARTKEEKDLKTHEVEQHEMAKEQKKEDEAQKAKAAKIPNVINVEQMKAYWVTSLPAPRPLDKDFQERSKTYNAVVTGIKTGHFDNLAQEKVYIWNISEYVCTGNEDKAESLRSDLAKLRQVMENEAQLAQSKRESDQARHTAMFGMMQWEAVQKQLSDMNYNLRQMR
jgi:hypothetical protein